MEVSNGIVVALGIGIVFAGLICLVVICSLLGTICKALVKDEAKSADAPKVVGTAANAASDAPVANKQELIAGICAVIAEELGTDASNIRVTSFKRV